MQVREAMSSRCATVDACDSVGCAAKLMAEQNVGCLPVNDNNRLVGILTDRDIVTRCVAQELSDSTLVADVMTRDIRHCFEDEDLNAVLRSMAVSQIRRLPVVDRNQMLVGILSLSDASRNVSASTAGAAFCSVTAAPCGHCDD